MSLIKNKLIKIAKSFFQNYHDSSFLFAYSGGVDSSVLLHILLDLKVRISVIYLAHFIRDEKISLEEEEFVKSKLKNLNLDFFIFSKKEGQIKKSAMKNKRSLEEEARISRYDFFRDIKNRYNYDYIILSHHKDDDLETQIMRMFSYSSLESIYGIKAQNNYILRPFLNIKKEEILSYAKQESISYYQDQSNFEDDFLRNKVRINLLPKIKEIFPNYQDALSKMKNDIGSLQTKPKLVFEEENNFCFTYFKCEINIFLKLEDKQKIKNIFTCYDSFLKKNPFSYSNYQNRFPSKSINKLIDNILKSNSKEKSTLFDAIGIVFYKEKNFFYLLWKENLQKKSFCFKISEDSTINLFDKKIKINKVDKEYAEKNKENCINIDYPVFIRNRTVDYSYKKIFQENNILSFFRDFIPILFKEDKAICFMFSFINYKNFIYYNDYGGNVFLHFKIENINGDF